MRGGSHSSNKKATKGKRKNQKDITVITDIDIYNNIYTPKTYEDSRAPREYFKVKEIEYGYHPSVYTENSSFWKKRFKDDFGINFWITKLDKVDETGRLIYSFPINLTVKDFLSKFKVWKNLSTNP